MAFTAPAAHRAKRWGKEVSREWVSCHLRLGRFRAFFITTGDKEGAPGGAFILPVNRTERAFRKFWEATSPGGDYRGPRGKVCRSLPAGQACVGGGLSRRWQWAATVAVPGRTAWSGGTQ
jgi:hypothetical protein